MESLNRADASSKASFSSLPFELRQMIWALTFEPRVLTVEAHTSEAYTIVRRKESKGHARSRPTRVTTWARCCIFTAKLGIHPSNNDRKHRNWGWKPAIRQEAQALLPPGPVALHVCRDSRAIALQRYRPAFRGSISYIRDPRFVEDWIEKGYDQTRIWVDYKQDTIYFYDSSTDNNFSGFPDEEAEKVEMLATFLRFDNLQATFDETENLQRFLALKVLGVYVSPGGPCVINSGEGVEGDPIRLAENLTKRLQSLQRIAQPPKVEICSYS